MDTSNHNITIAKIVINDGEDPYYIVTDWGDSNTSVTLVNKNEYWNGCLCPESFCHFYENLNMSEDQYMINTKKALSTNSKNNVYVFEFKNNVLKWKIDDCPIKIVHGKVNLSTYSQDGGTDILVDSLLKAKEYAEYKQRLQEQEGLLLADQLKVMIDKFEEFSRLKNEMENDIYVKFMHILNTKKERITTVEEFLHNARGDTKYVKIPALVKKSRPLHAMSDSESD